jgi:basic membrane protein A
MKPLYVASAFRRTSLFLLAVASAAAACGRPTAAEAPSNIRVGIVFDTGGKDDRSFNAAAWAGVSCAATGRLPDGTTSCGKPALGVTLRDVEPGTPTNIEPAMRTFAERGFDLVIAIGFAQAPILAQVARDYPNARFAIIDGVITEDDGKTPRHNVASMVFKEHEGSYLVGVLAALASKTGTVGFVGGMDIPLIRRFEQGYEEGARSARPDVRVVQNYVGVTDGAWNNPGKGKELAMAQIGKGADVIFAAAGNSGIGVFDAVEQAGMENGRARRLVIGVDSNQNGVKPGYVLTSMVKRVDNAVYDIIKDVVAGRFKGGLHVNGLESDAVGYSLDEFNRPLLTPEAVAAAEAARKKIIAGEVTVTDAMAQ